MAVICDIVGRRGVQPAQTRGPARSHADPADIDSVVSAQDSLGRERSGERGGCGRCFQKTAAGAVRGFKRHNVLRAIRCYRNSREGFSPALSRFVTIG